MADVRDMTPQVLADIRDELRSLNKTVVRMDGRLESMDGRLESMDGRLRTVEGHVRAIVGVLHDDVATEIASLKSRVSALERSKDSTDA